MPIVSKNASYASVTDADDPVENLTVVAPDDANDLAYVTRALYVGSAGDIKVTTSGGQVLVWAAVSVGWHPVRLSRIWATSTTATSMTAAW